VLEVSALEGVKDAVEPAYETVPAIAVVPCFSVNDAAVMVNGSIGTLKVAVTTLLRNTPVPLFNGLVEFTVGEGLALVLNVHT
jgi:hypothetical protein